MSRTAPQSSAPRSLQPPHALRAPPAPRAPGQACAAAGGDSYRPPLTVIVVSKGHGLRMLEVRDEEGSGGGGGGGDFGAGASLPVVANPPPGCVLDHTVTS
jgi:hypothetical protein